ncbi:matrixin family metalloprotease [Stieleria varia]|uniref:Matrixin n=1 Tax=Stieleria varia TaxID=2528005 RepID=A0A5C6ARQ8_9BACT|nr:matrixin family metalloprotease [Stieleria varia]TWU02258.1 Matrixin [Stieleria varia]
MSKLSSKNILTNSQFQTLEDRRMLVSYATPWPDAHGLTISFPNDGVEIASHQNNVNETLDAVASTEQWQELVLRAYQTWAIHADINVGVRNDFDSPFGTPGMTTGDPRFGEFRIGAIPQEGALANSIPFQAAAGTYSGDLVLNSNESFHYHDWAGGVGPDPSSLNAEDRDLFSLLLHETGNTLGLEDTSDSWMVMFRQYTTPRGILSQEDIDAIQSIYGARTDPYEQVDNGQIQVSTVISTPTGFSPTTEVLRVPGSLYQSSDVDHYKIVPAAGQDAVTIRLRASGISLLKSRLQLLDASGQILSESLSESVTDNDNVLQVNGIAGLDAIYIRVVPSDPTDVYSVGDYELQIDYRDVAVQAMDVTPGVYDAGPDAVFANFELITDELSANNTIADAETLVAETATGVSDRYEFESSVSAATDIDFFKITAPNDVQGRLVVHVNGVGADHPDVRVSVVDSNGQPVGTSARLRSDGTYTLEVAQPAPNADYFLRISVDPNSAVGVGNYVALAHFESPSTVMAPMFAGQASDDGDTFLRWTAEKSKLFRFDLAVSGGLPDQSVRLSIYDAHTRQLQLTFLSATELTRSAMSWLEQGDYILQFTANSVDGQSVQGLTYSISCDGLSDDQDGDSEDPSQNPYYEPNNYTYEYPNYEYEYQYEYQYPPYTYYDPYAYYQP